MNTPAPPAEGGAGEDFPCYNSLVLSQEAIQKILGIEEKVHLTPESMADRFS